MTEIKRAIKTIENRDSIMDYCENRQLSDALDLAIRSLKAWEEVIKELEYLKDKTPSPTMFIAYSELSDIINQHLSEIEE